VLFHGAITWRNLTDVCLCAPPFRAGTVVPPSYPWEISLFSFALFFFFCSRCRCGVLGFAGFAFAISLFSLVSSAFLRLLFLWQSFRSLIFFSLFWKRKSYYWLETPFPPSPGWILLEFDINFSKRANPSVVSLRSIEFRRRLAIQIGRFASFWNGKFSPLPPLCNFLHSWRKCRSRSRCLLVPTSW
jgi:hypothetical protein